MHGETAMRINSILIVKMSAIGDVVMSIPAFNALRAAYPHARIDWLVEPRAAGILRGLPGLDHLIEFPRSEIARMLRACRPVSALRLWCAFKNDLQSTRYDVVLDLQGLFKSALMVFLAKAARKAGFGASREYTGWALNERMPAYDPERHAVRRYLDAAVYLGAAYPDPEPEAWLDVPPAAKAEAEQILEGHERYIVLVPGCKPYKQWPPGHWMLLAEKIRSATGTQLVICGAREDRVLGEEIKKAAAGLPLNLCGSSSLPVLAAVLQKSSLVISGDTGPAHVAVAVGARGIALFGPTRPWRTGPFGERFTILSPSLNCLGCLKRRCAGNCMAQLSPDTVFSKVVELRRKA